MYSLRSSLLATLILALVSTSAVRADALWQANPKLKVAHRVPLSAQAFGLQDVRLLEGPFRQAMELDRQYLLSLDVDQLLHTFRLNAGLPSQATPLGGWEEPKGELRGHFAGHYLTAVALLYGSTGDARLKAKADALVAGLAVCQAKLPGGYLSAFPEEFFDRVENQQRVWAPYYTLHKLYAGLLDAYVYCDNPQALEVCRKFADWVIARNARLSDDRMQRMLDAEHGGMNEGLANLYALTGEEKYLAISRRFNHEAVIGPAARRQDTLTGLHANTQIPKFVGTARQYELTGEASLQTASRFFWDTVVKERSYVIGGHSDGEHFSPKETLSTAFGPSTTETCNTYNMLKLTRHLFAWEPRAEYADYYERALLNHILASQNPADGMTCYYVPLRPGSRKTYCDSHNSFWCCTGTGIENHAKYGDSIYFHDGADTLYVNLFIASELTHPTRGYSVRQETRFPEEDTTRLTLRTSQPGPGTLKLRYPAWARSGVILTVNGERQTVDVQPGSYLTMRREWRDGDRVEAKFPFSLRTEGFRDNPHRFAFLHGPVVLAAETDPRLPAPALVAEDAQVLSSLTPVSGRASTFTSAAGVFRVPGRNEDREVTLEPFYQLHGGRNYTVYFDQLTPVQWRTAEQKYAAEQARQQELEARTVDVVHPGGEQSERDHQLQGEQTGSGPFGDRRFRHATEGGWFSYVLKVLPDQPQELLATYWGSDAGGRVFDVLVDGVRIHTQRLEGRHPDRFFDEVYAIPAEQLRGKASITVKFQAHPDNFAGGVFGLRVMRSR